MCDPSGQGSDSKPDFPVRPWFQSAPTRINPDIRRILEASGIPSSEVENHIIKVRDDAWRVQPYVCFGQFMFIELKISTHPCFDEILNRLKAADTELLDVGCGLAQELRFLADRGVDSSRLTGMDNHDKFISFGYDLFRDRSTLKAHFVTADILDFDSMPSDISRSFNIIWGSATFHLFNWEGQICAFSNAIRLLKDKIRVGIYGWQAGHPETKVLPNKEKEGEILRFWHNPASFERLWDEIGKRTNTRWEVMNWNAGEVEKVTKEMKGVIQHFFAVERIAGAPGAETRKLDDRKPLWI